MTSERKLINFGIWSIGKHVEKKIIPMLGLVKACNLTGIYTRDKTKLKDYSNKLDFRSFFDKKEFLNDKDIDLIYISSPIGLHYEHCFEALSAGKHVLCEKTLVQTKKEAESLVKIARKSNLALIEAFMYKYHPQFTRIRDIVKIGQLGNIHSLISQFGIPFQDTKGWRFDSKLGGGSLLDVGTYPISLSLAILEGIPHISSCKLNYDNKFNIDLSGSVVLDFQGRQRAFLNWGMGLAYRNELEIWGSDGVLKSEFIFSKPDNFAAKIVISNSSGNQETEYLNPVDSFATMFDQISQKLDSPEYRESQYKDVINQAECLEKIFNSVK